MNQFKNKIFPWMPAVIWMIIIFYFSSQIAVESDGFSRGFTSFLINTFGKFLPLDVGTSTGIDIIAKYNHLVRKAAHFTIYLILGILVSYAFNKNRGSFSIKVFFYSFVLCVLYALSDEVHQLFVIGRGPQLKDVILDSIGSFTGLIIYRFIIKINKKV